MLGALGSILDPLNLFSGLLPSSSSPSQAIPTTGPLPVSTPGSTAYYPPATTPSPAPTSTTTTPSSVPAQNSVMAWLTSGAFNGQKSVYNSTTGQYTPASGFLNWMLLLIIVIIVIAVIVAAYFLLKKKKA